MTQGLQQGHPRFRSNRVIDAIDVELEILRALDDDYGLAVFGQDQSFSAC